MKKRFREPANNVDEAVVIESDPEDNESDGVIFVGEGPSTGTAAPPPEKKQKTGKTPQRNPLLSCPLSKADQECSRCKIVKVVNQKTLLCHCGAKIKLPKGRVEASVDHWQTSMFDSLLWMLERCLMIPIIYLPGACQSRTRIIGANRDLTTWIGVKKVGTSQSIKKVCSGLSDHSWKRPRGHHSIAVCISHSPTPYHGAK